MTGKIKYVVSWVMMILIGIGIGWSIPWVINWVKEPAAYRALEKQFVFSIDPVFVNYYLAINEVINIRYALNQKPLSEEKRSALLDQLAKAQQQVIKTNKALDTVLELAIKQYGQAVKPSISRFITWKNNLDINAIPYNKFHWNSQFSGMQKVIYNQLRKVSGYYNLSSIKEAW